jgi:hypothetical protein
MFDVRKGLYRQIEDSFRSKLLVYVTGDRQGQETQIHQEALDFLSDHLDAIGAQKKISLLLYSRGGQTLAGWSIVNLIRQYCDRFEVIIPSKAHSTATLIAIGADSIVMTKQAALGPIDPSVNSPLNPQLPGAPPNARVPISVEAVAGYFDLARNELRIRDQRYLAEIFHGLSETVNPIALGGVYRARAQIQMLADKLLSYHLKDSRQKKDIISFICSESGSHDYTINRQEATDRLGLPVHPPSEEQDRLLKAVYNDIREELQLNQAFNANVILGNRPTAGYISKRCIVESIGGGSSKFVTEGTLTRRVNEHTSEYDILNMITFEGWRDDAE